MPSNFVALPSLLPLELLSYILAHQTYPTTLIICQTRKDFTESLLCDLSPNTHNQFASQTCHHSTHDPSAQSQTSSTFSFLTPTLHHVASSRHTNLVFIPTVSHLRAYLAVFPAITEHSAPPDNWLTGIPGETPLLVLYGLIDLHHDTNEWSAQGLGNTLAGLVEAGHRSSRKVIILEKWSGDVFDDVKNDTNMDLNDISRCSIWNIRVPMLNMNVKNSGLHSEDVYLNERTTEIGRILARWFKFSTHK